jgi:ABC-type multidrug transport system ATPase subunit
VAGRKVVEDVSFEVAAGELLCIAGPVGCGKTSLLLALLSELQPSSGSINVRGRIAYTSQEAWVDSRSLRDSVTMFGDGFKQDWYDQVVDACGLRSDFEGMPFRDLTEVGERGVTLSGGQKARLSLARAVYANHDVYLLDDPLSAVDVHVGKHIFDKCIRGLLRNKIVVLVTHQTQFLPLVDRVLVLNPNGTTSGLGSFAELVGLGVLQDIVVEPEQSKPQHAQDLAREDQARPQHVPRSYSKPALFDGVANNLIQPEKQSSGEFKWSILFKYMAASGVAAWVIFHALVGAGITLEVRTRAMPTCTQTWYFVCCVIDCG